MEPSGPQPGFESRSDPDFDETIPDGASLGDEVEAGFSNIRSVSNLDEAMVQMTEKHPDYEILNVTGPILGVRIAIIRCAEDGLIMLKEDLWSDNPPYRLRNK